MSKREVQCLDCKTKFEAILLSDEELEAMGYGTPIRCPKCSYERCVPVGSQ